MTSPGEECGGPVRSNSITHVYGDSRDLSDRTIRDDHMSLTAAGSDRREASGGVVNREGRGSNPDRDCRTPDAAGGRAERIDGAHRRLVRQSKHVGSADSAVEPHQWPMVGCSTTGFTSPHCVHPPGRRRDGGRPNHTGGRDGRSDAGGFPATAPHPPELRPLQFCLYATGQRSDSGIYATMSTVPRAGSTVAEWGGDLRRLRRAPAAGAKRRDRALALEREDHRHFGRDPMDSAPGIAGTFRPVLLRCGPVPTRPPIGAVADALSHQSRGSRNNESWDNDPSRGPRDVASRTAAEKVEPTVTHAIQRSPEKLKAITAGHHGAPAKSRRNRPKRRVGNVIPAVRVQRLLRLRDEKAAACHPHCAARVARCHSDRDRRPACRRAHLQKVDQSTARRLQRRGPRLDDDVSGLGVKWKRGYGRWGRDILAWTKAPFLFRDEPVLAGSLAAGPRTAKPGEVRRLGKHPTVLTVAVEGGAR